MTEGRRTNGLLCGGLTAFTCTGGFAMYLFFSGEWYYAIPIAGMLWWGVIALHELVQQNDRREKILKINGIDERKSTI